MLKTLNYMISEKDLGIVLCNYLKQKGFRVRSEVEGCDIVYQTIHRRKPSFAIVEIKLQFNLKLLYQVAHRLTLTEQVYIAILRPDDLSRKSPWRNIKRLCQSLGIGIYLLSPKKSNNKNDKWLVQLALDCGKTLPYNSKKAKKLKKEFELRQVDHNQAGQTKQPIITAYREQSIEVAELLNQKGALKLPR